MIAWMPKQKSLAAGCVVHRIVPSTLPASIDEWLRRIEARLDEMGYFRARLYLQSEDPTLAAVLNKQGYVSSREIGFLKAPPFGPSPSTEYSFDTVSSEEDWKAKLQLHQACTLGPDRYPCNGDAWVQMERRKAEAGYMVPFLARLEGVACGTVSIAASDHLLRLKNIVVHPDFRGMGIGTQLVRHVLRETRKRSKRAVGVFGVEGSAGASLYESHKFSAATTQVEWTKELGAHEEGSCVLS